jgi:hypothetical protein
MNRLYDRQQTPCGNYVARLFAVWRIGSFFVQIPNVKQVACLGAANKNRCALK